MMTAEGIYRLLGDRTGRLAYYAVLRTAGSICGDLGRSLKAFEHLVKILSGFCICPGLFEGFTLLSVIKIGVALRRKRLARVRLADIAQQDASGETVKYQMMDVKEQICLVITADDSKAVKRPLVQIEGTDKCIFEPLQLIGVQRKRLNTDLSLIAADLYQLSVAELNVRIQLAVRGHGRPDCFCKALSVDVIELKTHREIVHYVGFTLHRVVVYGELYRRERRPVSPGRFCGSGILRL